MWICTSGVGKAHDFAFLSLPAYCCLVPEAVIDGHCKCTVLQTDRLLHIYTLHALRLMRSESMLYTLAG